jgi:hypothetical protein
MGWMRLTLLPALLLGCNDAGFDAVTIRPTSGWVDGCADLTIAGHGFDNGVTAKIGPNEVTNITLPDAKKDPLEVGFEFFAVSPPGEQDFHDVVVTNGDGESATINKGFYYAMCTRAPLVESATPAATAGAQITVTGCGFAADMQATLVSLDDETVTASAALALECSTAVVSFAAPALPDGSYLLEITDAAGAVLYPLSLCDTADTGNNCDQPYYITYGATTGSAS